MTADESLFRGHRTRPEGDHYVYCDTGEPVEETWRDRGCGHCGKADTPEGHDGCLGTLPGVRNACCGHGETPCAYVQLDDGTELREEDAVAFFACLSRRTEIEPVDDDTPHVDDVAPLPRDRLF